MLYGLFGRVSAAPQLREALDASAARRDAISQRVATASVGNATGFALPGVDAATTGAVDLEAEMVNLADETGRYEATAKLLERTYTALRQAIRER